MNPLDVPDDATLGGTLHIGNPTVKGEGLKVKYWTGSMPGKKGRGCSMAIFGHSVEKECVFELMVSHFFRFVLHVYNHGLPADQHHLLR